MDFKDINPPKRTSEVPATHGQLNAMEGRLSDKIEAHRLENRASFDELKAMMKRQDSRGHTLELMYEEQKAQNVYVLDGYAQMYEKMEELTESVHKLNEKGDRTEMRLIALEDMVRAIYQKIVGK